MLESTSVTPDITKRGCAFIKLANCICMSIYTQLEIIFYTHGILCSHGRLTSLLFNIDTRSIRVEAINLKIDVTVGLYTHKHTYTYIHTHKHTQMQTHTHAHSMTLCNFLRNLCNRCQINGDFFLSL